jgi:hypothetical protein
MVADMRAAAAKAGVAESEAAAGLTTRISAGDPRAMLPIVEIAPMPRASCATIWRSNGAGCPSSSYT